MGTTLSEVEELQNGLHEVTLRVGQLEAERNALEQENKALRMLLERLIDHRQKSHSELVLLLAGLVSKLPINDVGGIVSRLVEHNKNVADYLAALIKGTSDAAMPQIAILKTLDTAKHDIAAAIKPLVDELISLNSPFEKGLLEALVGHPEEFFTQRMLRANRCFMKGCVSRDRIVREFGDTALPLFVDLTTDPKRNPHPKPEEIVLGFRNDFAEQLPAAPLDAEKKAALESLYRSVQGSRSATDQARAQRHAFVKLSFLLEVLHFYEERCDPADVIFAQRLPNLVEQLVIAGPDDPLDEKLIAEGEHMLAFIVNPDHRHTVVNNMGKSNNAGKTLRFVLKLRGDKVPDDPQVIAEFVRHLLPAGAVPAPEVLARVLHFIHPDMQRAVIKALMVTDRVRHDQADQLARAIAGLLNIQLPRAEEVKASQGDQLLIERQRAWADIKKLIRERRDAATVAAAIRDRLNARYDNEEIRTSWITLTECEPMTLIRVFCSLPYLPTGKTDPISRPVLETYVSRLTHEKYGTTYQKVVNSLKNMFHAKADSPTLLTFVALVRWVNPEAADKLTHEIGMPVPAH